jgi:hypothetical protein
LEPAARSIVAGFGYDPVADDGFDADDSAIGQPAAGRAAGNRGRLARDIIAPIAD